MEDLKKKINFDPSLLYYSPTSKDTEEDEKSPVTNVETYNSTNRKHVCTVCGKRFFSISALSVHMEHHPPNERSNIEKDDDNANSNRKNQYVWDNGIKCNKLECNFIALDAVEYSKHISSCEGTRLTKDGENISFCDLCDSYFSSDNHFKAHLILQHPDCDPDISLKEYDAKYTTVSDPVSLYVSENSENDSDVRQAKNFSHSKYPDSSISKRKSKESENEEVLQKNPDTNKTMDEVTVVTNSIEADSAKVGLDEVVLDTEEKSSEVSVSETLTNSKPHVQIENGKCDDENTEEFMIQSSIEKLSNDQSEVSVLNQNDADADSNTKEDNSVPANSENTSTNNEISSKEKSSEEQTGVSNKPSPDSSEVKSNDKDMKTKNGELSDKMADENVDDTEVPQTVSEEKKEVDVIETDSEKVEAKDNDDKQENYMNVEKMMYNLFKDEGTAVTPSQERGDIQDLNDGSPEKQKENNEQNQTSNPIDSTKDESDFEDFDYTKAGKKKYLKSYSRLNKSKVNVNEEEKTNDTAEVKEEAEAEAVEKNQSVGLDGESKKKKPVGRKRKQSSTSETPVTDLNIKERSTRTRKKLILPDFEYDSDYKSYTPDAPSRRSEIPKRPSLPKNDDSSPRKRGRPRKNQDLSLNSSDVDKSANTTDMSTNSANKSAAGVKSRIENSYLNASETSMKRDIADIKIKSDSFNTSNSSVSESFSQGETSEAEKKPKLQDITKNISESETVPKKKRGRPKSKTGSELQQSKLPPPSSTADKSTEESICSDIANALLSLGDSVPRKETVVQKSTAVSVSEKIDQVHIIKRKKMNTVKPVDSNATLKDDLENISTFELKNDLEGDLGDVSGELDTDLSFNDANKFEKEKESEENATSFMKDLSSTADVSTPKKRGRPPKIRKGPKPNALSQKTPVSGSQVPSKPKLSKSLPIDGEKRIDKIFDAALSDRKSVFLKNKAKMKNEFRKELNSTLPTMKKKGRPLKSLSDTGTKPSSSFTNQSIKSKAKKQTIIPHGARPIHDIRIDEPDAPKPIKEKPPVKITVSKKKKKRLGRPPKSASTNTSLQKEDTSKTSEKDLNLNELTSSRRARENSPFIYESYHPKKKRARLDTDSQDSEKDASASKAVENVVPKKIPRIPKPKKPPPPPPVEEPDETRNIDEELYLEDVKNRTKYGKLFKKVKSFIYDEKYTDDMIINCGRCKKKMTFRHYKNYHQLSHYYVSWIEGDQEINLQDDSDVVRHLQSAITPEALKKKAIRLACEKCNDVRKSVVGYVSHVRFCQKEDKNSLFETCKLCQKALRPSSVRFHYIKFHGCYKPSKGGMCFSDEADFFDSSQDFSREDSDGTGTPLKKRFRMGFTRKELLKKDIVEDEGFWTALKTSCDLYMCMGLSCRHMAISKEELKAHILECLSRFCEFSCSSCTYKTKYENEIIYHSKKKCLGEASDISIEALASNRVTTRGKTLNFKFANDLNDASDDEKKRTDRGDQDFEVGDDKTDDEEFEDSDMEFEKSSLRKVSKRKKTERSSVLSTSVSDKLGLRNAFQQYCVGRADPLRWTVDLRLKLFSSTPLHVHMKISSKEWDPLPPSDTEKYIPVHKKSVKAYFDSGLSSQYDLFQADVIKGVPLCYVGGPVWAMAWAPIPAHVTEQYLAVSTLQHMNHLVEINESVSFPSLIQFWKFSSLDNISNDIQKPILGWSIAHSYGAVWSMEWCPSGGFNNLSTTTRLGILAAATSSGCVVIYNVPKLEASDKEPKETMANPKPDLILKIRNDNVQCTRIVWDQISPHNSLIGGFSDGSIAFWNINTASVLLKKGNIIYPYRTFDAHNSPITALDLHWLNNSRYLLTGSMNRVTRHWDLNDLSGPINEYERPTPVMNAAWMQHWIVTANVHDFGNLVGESGAFIAHPRDPFEKKKTIMNIRDAFWSLSYSLWNDTVAVSSNGGYVSAYAAKHLSMLTFKSPDFDKTITLTELVDLNDEEKKNFNSEELTNTMPSSNDLLDCTTIIKNNGIRFSDRAKNNTNSETLSFDVEKCNPTSVNKVCWNQNYNSFNWLAIGYECGFVRVIRVERFDKHYLTKFYKTNENTATLM